MPSLQKKLKEFRKGSLSSSERKVAKTKKSSLPKLVILILKNTIDPEQNANSDKISVAEIGNF